MSEVKPIKPEEILGKKFETIPSAMIQAVNELLAKYWDGNSSIIRRDTLTERYFKLIGNQRNDRASRDELYDNHSFDFIEIYKKEGWCVVFNQPIPSRGDMDFEPYYEFTLPNGE